MSVFVSHVHQIHEKIIKKTLAVTVMWRTKALDQQQERQFPSVKKFLDPTPLTTEAQLDFKLSEEE